MSVSVSTMDMNGVNGKTQSLYIQCLITKTDEYYGDITSLGEKSIRFIIFPRIQKH